MRPLFMAALFFCTIAQAVAGPVTYTVTGRLEPGDGSDLWGLAGARLSLSVTVPAAAPALVMGSPGDIISAFDGPFRAILTLSPPGAATQTVTTTIASAAGENASGPGMGDDSWFLDQSAVFPLQGHGGVTAWLNGITFNLAESFFPGSGEVTAPPVFTASEVAQVLGGGLFVRPAGGDVAWFALTDMSYGGTPSGLAVPEPAAVLPLGTALAVAALLGWRRRRG